MGGLVRAGVDGDIAGVGIAHQIAVGARAGHHAGVGRGQAQQVFAQRHGFFKLPVQVVTGLPVGVHHLQLAIGHVGFHVPCVFALDIARARATAPQQILAFERIQHSLCAGKAGHALQRALGREDDEQVFFGKALQRVLRANPGRLKLFGFIGLGRLALWHAGHKKRYVETLGQIARRRPVRQIPELIDRQRPASGAALLVQRCFAIKLLHLGRSHALARLVIGQQNAQLFKSLADAGQRLGNAGVAASVQHGLAHAGQCMVGGVRVLRLQSTAGENIGIGEVALVGTAGHQHLVTVAIGAVAQQQDGGGVTRVHRLALGL